MLYVCVRGVMDVVFSVCIVSCVHPVAVLNDAFCVLHDLELVNSGRGCDARGDHMEEAYSRAG